MITTSEDKCDNMQEIISDTFKFYKKNRGFAFSIPFMRWKLKEGQDQRNIPRNIKPSYFCIMTIVDKGRSKECIKAARSAGARDVTIIHGHGAGVPTDFYFPLVIEPQKDIVIFITAKDKVTQIRDRIFTELELEKEGRGIIFVLPVLNVNGLSESRSVENREVRS